MMIAPHLTIVGCLAIGSLASDYCGFYSSDWVVAFYDDDHIVGCRCSESCCSEDRPLFAGDNAG